MAVNPNDARFFLTLCNYLKKNNISFEVIEKNEAEYNGQLYDTFTEQFGVVEHSKESLMTTFEQIASMFNISYKKLFLYRFYFDVIDEITSIGQYTLQYILVTEEDHNDREHGEIEEIAENESITQSVIETEEELLESEFEESEIYEEEILEDSVISEESLEEKKEIDIEEEQEMEENQEVSHNQEEDSLIIEEEQEISKDNESISKIESQFIQQTLITENQENKSATSFMKNTKKDDNLIKSTDNYTTEFYNLLQTDIDYLIKLLDKKINSEVSEVLSKAIMIVIRNRFESD